jgi:hypothetical protein
MFLKTPGGMILKNDTHQADDGDYDGRGASLSSSHTPSIITATELESRVHLSLS